MVMALGKNARTNRREDLRHLLGSDRVSRKGKVHVLRQYVARHFRAILAGLLLATVAATQIYYYNKLTTMRQQVLNLRAHIGGGLQMRQNILPGLTIAVNRFMSYEKNIFLSAVDSREKSVSVSKDMEKLAESLKGISEGSFSQGDLSRLMAVAENYPQLVSIESYKLLLAQIADVEQQLYAKRNEYNNAVNEYNTSLNRFPANAAGAIMGFHSEPYFTYEQGPEWVFVADSESTESPLKVTSKTDAPDG